MKVHVCYEALYGFDITIGSKQEAFYDEKKAIKYCEDRQVELDKLRNNAITAKYWTVNVT